MLHPWTEHWLESGAASRVINADSPGNRSLILVVCGRRVGVTQSPFRAITLANCTTGSPQARGANGKHSISRVTQRERRGKAGFLGAPSAAETTARSEALDLASANRQPFRQREEKQWQGPCYGHGRMFLGECVIGKSHSWTGVSDEPVAGKGGAPVRSLTFIWNIAKFQTRRKGTSRLGRCAQGLGQDRPVRDVWEDFLVG
jgi:hypothetical protein